MDRLKSFKLFILEMLSLHTQPYYSFSMLEAQQFQK